MLTITQQDQLLTLLQANFTNDLTGYKPLLMLGQPIGYINSIWSERLVRDLGQMCSIDDAYVTLHEQDPLALSDMLQTMGRQWHKTGELSGWRNELFDVKNHDGKVLFQLERALFRPFGLLSQSVHINGLYLDADQTQLWIGTRSPFKAVDPNKLDNLVGGGITTQETVHEAAIREAEEEAGVPAALLQQAKPALTCLSQRHVSRGLHREYLHIYHLDLPLTFQPQNQDGEVAEFHLYCPETIVTLMLEGRFMNDALLATLFALQKLGLMMPEHPLSRHLDQLRIQNSSKDPHNQSKYDQIHCQAQLAM